MRKRSWRAESREIDLDNPRTTESRRDKLKSHRFLREIYDEWYQLLMDSLPEKHETVLELGSGPGFLKDRIPNLVTSDVMQIEGVDRVENATQLTFDTSSLDAIVMTDVFHHIQRPREFLNEANRCLRVGGRLIMIEPWCNPWSKIVYRWFHHEPFEPNAKTWELPEGGPLSIANGALPYICFSRDFVRFSRLYPSLRLRVVEPFMPFTYLLSGGFSFTVPLSPKSYRYVRCTERMLGERKWGMFALLVLERTQDHGLGSSQENA